MYYRRAFFSVAAVLLAAALPAWAQKPDSKSINITYGPAKVKLEKIAEVEVPAEYLFLDGKTTRALMKAQGEPVSGQELGLLEATNEHFSVMFEFSDVGYVKDSDKDKLDPEKLLAQIKKGNDAANKERVRAGRSPLEIVGWEIPPRYDEKSHNLEWAIRATSDDHQILNYNTRLLGRKGVMEVVLIVEPDKLQQTLPAFRSVLASHTFQTGQNYAEYRPGDKVAKYGLAALVVGGSTVVAAKLGLLAWLAVVFKKAWKLVILAVVAVIAFFKNLFARITGRRRETGT